MLVQVWIVGSLGAMPLPNMKIPVVDAADITEWGAPAVLHWMYRRAAPIVAAVLAWHQHSDGARRRGTRATPARTRRSEALIFKPEISLRKGTHGPPTGPAKDRDRHRRNDQRLPQG